jgi:hypothetical protein
VAERNQFGGAFGSLDTGDFGNGQHVAFFHLPVADEGQRLRFHHNFAARNCKTFGIVLLADIDHIGAAFFIEVGELSHSQELYRSRGDPMGRPYNDIIPPLWT